MLIIFSVNDQKITHDLKGQLVAGSVDIVQAITVQKCGDGGDCDLLRYLAQGQVADGKVAKDEEVEDMLDTVFGKPEAPKPDPGGSDSNDKNVSEDDIATDKDVADMLNKVFG